MAIKIDVQKAYDTISWDFIHSTLIDCKLEINIINLIMDCITSPSISVLINGKPSYAFNPGCGIRQGDPISPYLFILYMESLSRKISDATTNNA